MRRSWKKDSFAKPCIDISSRPDISQGQRYEPGFFPLFSRNATVFLRRLCDPKLLLTSSLLNILVQR